MGNFRVSSGVLTGGQFASSPHAESFTVLDPAHTPVDGNDAEAVGEQHPDGDWRANGFSVREAEEWFDSGFGRKQATDWKAFGFSPAEVTGWREADMTPGQAREWVSTGRVLAPERARRWAEAGFHPEDDHGWLQVGPPETAAAFRDAGFPHQRAHEWAQETFTADEATAWRTSAPHVTPLIARLHRDSGVTPETFVSAKADLNTAPAAQPARPKRVPDPLRAAGPFRVETIDIAQWSGDPIPEGARVVGGLGVHRSDTGWVVTHVASGWAMMPPLSRKADADKCAKAMVVIDPQICLAASSTQAQALGRGMVFADGDWIPRSRIAALVRDWVRRPNSSCASQVAYLLENPIGSDPAHVEA